MSLRPGRDSRLGKSSDDDSDDDDSGEEEMMTTSGSLTAIIIFWPKQSHYRAMAQIQEPSSNKSPPARIVIVGAGFGGLFAVKKLKNVRAEVVAIDSQNHHLFQPLLYQVATAGLSPAEIAVPIRSILRDQLNTEVVMAEVTGVDKVRRLVLLPGRVIPYDYLVIATGASPSYFGHDEWESFAPGLKSVEDAIRLRAKILVAFEGAEIETEQRRRRELLTFIIVGGGPTGVELAGAISELSHYALKSNFRHIDPKDARVLLIEADKRILPSFPEYLSMKAEEKLREFGVEVLTDTRVTEIDERGLKAGNERFDSPNIIWAAGVRPSPAAAWLGCPTDKSGRLLVGPDLGIPGDSRIFAIGDVACVMQDGKALPQVAPVAMQEGRYVSELILRRLRGDAEIAPFRYHDRGSLAAIGRSFAVADIFGMRISGFFAWLVWLAVHIYYLIGFKNRLFVLLQWAWAYFTFKRGARLITEIPAEKYVPVSPRHSPLAKH